MKSKGIIFDIKRFAIHDGPGIRTTVFFKGCPLNCHWCHNPESRSPVIQTIDDKGEKEVIGTEVTALDVMQEIEKETLFHDQSGGGVTFSGGEPLSQPRFLSQLLHQCHIKEIHTTLDTTGFATPEVFESILPLVDLFLYDLKLIDDQKHRFFTGVSNALILNNIKHLDCMNKKTVIRVPVIPGITDSEANIRAIANFISSLKHLRHVHLLPFHKTAENKYRRLHLPYLMKDVLPPTSEQMKEVKNIFEKYCQDIIISSD